MSIIFMERKGHQLDMAEEEDVMQKFHMNHIPQYAFNIHNPVTTTWYIKLQKIFYFYCLIYKTMRLFLCLIDKRGEGY